MSWHYDKNRHKIAGYGGKSRQNYNSAFRPDIVASVKLSTIAPIHTIFAYSDNTTRTVENGRWLESRLQEKLQDIEGIRNVYLDDWSEYSGRLIVELNFRHNSNGYYNDGIPLRKISARINAVCREYNNKKASLVGSCQIITSPKKVYDYDPYYGKKIPLKDTYDKNYYIIDYEI